MRIKSPLELPPHLRAQVQAEYRSVPAAIVNSNPGATDQKYGNEKVEIDGRHFDSKWEAQRYLELREQERMGVISDLRHKVEYPLHVFGPLGRVRVASYQADFVYRPNAVGGLTHEDTKSAATRRKEAYRLKAKMFEAEYGVRLLEVVKAPRTRRNREVIA